MTGRAPRASQSLPGCPRALGEAPQVLKQEKEGNGAVEEGWAVHIPTSPGFLAWISRQASRARPVTVPQVLSFWGLASVTRGHDESGGFWGVSGIPAGHGAISGCCCGKRM